MPLYRFVWFSPAAIEWRLNSDSPAKRISAIRDIGYLPSVEGVLLDKLIHRMRNDESSDVRVATINALGQHGQKRALSDPTIAALSELILTAEDDVILSATIVAVGQSALYNQYREQVIDRIASVFNEQHAPWLYSRAISALGQLGAAQQLPEHVVAVVNALFTDPVRPGDREDVARAFSEMSKGRSLPLSTLTIIADALPTEPNHRIRGSIIYAIAYSAVYYPKSVAVLREALNSPDPNTVQAAEHALHIVRTSEMLADKDLLMLALDVSEPPKARLTAMRAIRGSHIDPAMYPAIVSLAADQETDIAVVAIGMFRRFAKSPTDDFESAVLIPAIKRAMTAPDPAIRHAAYGVLSRISRRLPSYVRAADLPAQIDIGMSDPDPKVRTVVLLMKIREASVDAERDSLIQRAITDPDPYVRRIAVGWLGTPTIQSARRHTFITQALQDNDHGVRVAAESALKRWNGRERPWPIKLWQMWQAGDVEKFWVSILIMVTVATPILIGGAFLLYFVARLLTYLQQRRWRAAGALGVVGIWGAASYGLFVLYFFAALAGDVQGAELAMLSGVLWGAIAAYTALGWGMHYLVRR